MKSGDDIIRFLLEVVRNFVGDGGFTDDVAEQIEQQMRAEYGGQSVYVAKLASSAKRDAVLRMFNGRNRRDVCTALGLSKAQFYRYLKGGCDE